jgi:hypothetical protein
MNAILQTARKYGQVRSGFRRAFTELCVRVTEEAANRQLRRGGIEDLYEAWRDGSAFANQTERSLQVQLSKLRVFWDFGHEFGIQGITYVRNWYDNKVPDVGLNMFPTELRKRLKRGYI